jgi:hypothetical protein
MTEERAVLAGGCFWGMQDLIRRYDGVKSTRVGYSGGEVPNATYRNHGTHAEPLFSHTRTLIAESPKNFRRYFPLDVLFAITYLRVARVNA